MNKELLIANNLNGSSKMAPSRSIARARTLIIFKQLDGDRKGDALQFLYETGLISSSEPVVRILGLNLDNAILDGATLSDVNLAGISCAYASLKDASFSNSILTGCTFTDSDMQGVDFSGASLDQAILSGCNLANAEFAGANLDMADFRGASVEFEQLGKAKSLEFAIMPDGNTYRGGSANNHGSSKDNGT